MPAPTPKMSLSGSTQPGHSPRLHKVELKRNTADYEILVKLVYGKDSKQVPDVPAEHTQLHQIIDFADLWRFLTTEGPLRHQDGKQAHSFVPSLIKYVRVLVTDKDGCLHKEYNETPYGLWGDYDYIPRDIDSVWGQLWDLIPTESERKSANLTAPTIEVGLEEHRVEQYQESPHSSKLIVTRFQPH